MVNHNSAQKNRISWIDLARGIGICLVVMGHVYRSNPVLIWICSFHMPLFFILSGWLRGCERKQVEWGRFIRKKCESFIVPLLIFLIITFLYWLIVERQFREFEIGPMWFLPVLFFAEIVAEIIIDYMGVKFAWGGVILSGVLLYLCSRFIGLGTVLAWIPRCFGALTFYLFGVAMDRVVTTRNVKDKIPRSVLLCIIAVSAVLSVTLSQINGRVGLYSLLFGNMALYFICAIIGSCLIFGIALSIGTCKPLEYLGRYSIIILCTHEQVKRALIQILSITLKIPSEELRNHIIYGFIISMIIVLIEAGVVMLVVKIGDYLKRTRAKWLVAFIK